MFFFPIKYDEPVFRPPAEAYSAILQITKGCSYNKCVFCEMYKSKSFSIKDFETIKNEIEQLAEYYKGVKKIFLADGDAMVLSANKLLSVLDEINLKFGRLQRVSAYALPSNLLSKTDKELKQLRENGLKLLYIGIESGDNELLRLVNKGESYESSLEGVKKAHNAGIDTSIMILNGLGGRKYSYQHAINSAKIISEINPKFLSTLTLSFPFGIEKYKKNFGGEYIQQTLIELFEELRLFIENIDGDNIIFRSNHVSNNLNLEGTLAKDKQGILDQLDQAIRQTASDEYSNYSGIL